jgi:hypothetical protein
MKRGLAASDLRGIVRRGGETAPGSIHDNNGCFCMRTLIILLRLVAAGFFASTLSGKGFGVNGGKC